MECTTLFEELQSAYRKRLAFYHREFSNGLTGKPVMLPRVLCTQEGEPLDCINSFMNMTFNLSKWLEGNAPVFPDKAELLRMPQLAVATLTPFQYVSVCDEASSLEFIRAHIGDPGEVSVLLWSIAFFSQEKFLTKMFRTSTKQS